MGEDEGTKSLAIAPLDNEFMLQHDKIPLSRLVAHEFLQLAAQRIEEVSSMDNGLIGREKFHPPEA